MPDETLTMRTVDAEPDHDTATDTDTDTDHDYDPGDVATRRPGLGIAIALALLVIGQGIVALDLDLPVLRPVVALVTLLGVPTLVLARRAGLPGDGALVRALYAFGLSMLAVIVGGLVVNTVLPVVGIDRPLQPAVLAVTWLVIDAALLLWRREVPLLPAVDVRALDLRAVGLRVLRTPIEPAQGLAALSVVVAVIGAIRLNNGAGGEVAFLGQALAGIALLVVMLQREPGTARTAWTIALTATSLLLSTSLRGWYVLGHDVQAEYLAFDLTNDAQHWVMSALPSAYNACLSVNILPTVIAQTTGLSGAFVFKVVLQLVFALVPVLTYLMARRVVGTRLGLVAAVLTMAFPTFFTDMPYLVRQEIAFLFLGLLLLAATETGASQVWRRGLIATFGVGVVLSHYSTTYVLLMALVLATLAMSVVAAVRRRRTGEAGATLAQSRSELTILHPLVVAFLVATTLLWAGPITHTGGHATDVARATFAALTGKGDSGPASSDVSYGLFSGDEASARHRMNLFVDETLDYRAHEIAPADRLVKPLGDQELQPALHPRGDTAAPTFVGRALRSVGLPPIKVNATLKLAGALLLQVFLLAGLVHLLRRRKTPLVEQDPASVVEPVETPTRELTLLTFGAMAALALIALVPNLSVDYGVLRAFQQTLLVVAPMMAVGLWVLLTPLKTRRPTLVAVIPALLLLVLAGVVPALIGGQQQRIALSNDGLYYDRFFVSDAENQAVTWLSATDAAEQWQRRIIANRNVNVRMLTASDNAAPIADRLFPTLLSKGDYVFVDKQILDKGVSNVFYTGDVLTYDYPLKALNRRLDLVYSSPDARVYR